MTTTDEALTEQIARAMYEAEIEDDWLYELNEYKEPYLIFAAAVLPIIRKAQADAWDEGHRDTLAYVASGNLNGDEHHATPTNPYRTEETP